MEELTGDSVFFFTRTLEGPLVQKKSCIYEDLAYEWIIRSGSVLVLVNETRTYSELGCIETKPL